MTGSGAVLVFLGEPNGEGVETKTGSNVPKIILDPSNGSVLRRI